MRISTSALGLFAALSLVLSVTAHAQAREEGRLLIASQILEELRDTPDQSIPDRLLDRAYGIAVIPDLAEVAFFVGGRWGRGVLVVRDSKGQFGDPVFISMTGGSFGWQWGVQSTDIVLVFTTEKGVRGFSGGKLTLGADASVAAGPVGRGASAATDQSFKAEVSTTRETAGSSPGSPGCTVISISDSANEEFYKKPNVSASDIMNGNVTSQDPAVQRFMAAVATSTGTQRTASVAGPTPVPPAIQASAPVPAPAPKAPAAGGAQTFPLADPAPGQEPSKSVARGPALAGPREFSAAPRTRGCAAVPSLRRNSRLSSHRLITLQGHARHRQTPDLGEREPGRIDSHDRQYEGEGPRPELSSDGQALPSAWNMPEQTKISPVATKFQEMMRRYWRPPQRLRCRRERPDEELRPPLTDQGQEQHQHATEQRRLAERRAHACVGPPP